MSILSVGETSTNAVCWRALGIEAGGELYSQLNLTNGSYSYGAGTSVATGIASGNPSGDNAGVLNRITLVGGSTDTPTFYTDDIKLSVFYPQGTLIVVE